MSPWYDDEEAWRALVRRGFVVPEESALEGWEPLEATRARVVPTVRRLLDRHLGEDVVLCGHATVWTVLVSALTGRPPDLDAWERLAMPDLWVVSAWS